jgi:hypothetical protein
MDHLVSAADLRLHIERIVEHLEFRDSPRHRQLLRYLANHAIATGGRSVSPQAIEADVLARSAGGRGRAVTPARVLVDDVRRKLERYAVAAGRGDAIVISIPLDDCRLEARRNTPVEVAEHTPLPPGTPRPVVLVVEFDAEPAARSLTAPLAEAIGERLGRHGGISVILPVSRQDIADRGLAIEHAPAAWDADAGVHGMLMALPGEPGLEASIGASVRLINADAAVVWTLWCEEPMAGTGSDALDRMAEKIACFAADGVRVSRTQP